MSAVACLLRSQRQGKERLQSRESAPRVESPYGRAGRPAVAAPLTAVLVCVLACPAAAALSSGQQVRTAFSSSPCHGAPSLPGATLFASRDLYCVFLTARPGLEPAGGRLELRTPPSPFGVAVNVAGNHLYEGVLTLEGLPEPETLGEYEHFVAWLATPLFDVVHNLGPVSNGARSIGEISLNKFMILVTAEARTDASEWEGRLVLRASSPSARMSPPDMQEFLIGATGTQGDGAGAAEGGPHAEERAASTDMAMAGHGHRGDGPVGPDGWPRPPMMPGLTMFPALMALDAPNSAPFLPATAGQPSRNSQDVREGAAAAPFDPAALPLARPREVVPLEDGDAIALEAGLVRRRIRGRDHVMYAFNGQYPGPLLHVPEAATVTVDFTNSVPWPTTIHWHGLRLDNASDGVPGVTQEPVQPGETFRYEVFFKDPGVYWYHPHHREDVLKDLGLYGNMLVEPSHPDYYAPADREEVVMLDDFLMAGDQIMPFGEERSTHAFMGRFGNLMLVNGEPEYELSVEAGEVVRLYLTNVSNTRTFNLSFANAGGGAQLTRTSGGAQPGEISKAPLDGTGPAVRMKVIGTDVSAFEREEWVESIVLSPAERYVVHVRFGRPGHLLMVNRVQGIDHLGGAFFSETDTLGVVRVAAAEPGAEPSQAAIAFDSLRTNVPAAREIALFRDYFDDPVDHELTFTLETSNVPFVVDRLMRFDSAYFHPVEWSGTMPMMNWNSTSDQVRWIVRDPSTGRENMEIGWEFRVGDVVKVRLHNERRSFHAMQHPFHIHGQRFLVLSRNGVPNENLAWKDTVLLPTGTTTDILLEITNPGRWMAHCHISEHLESGMRTLFTVNR